MRKDPVDRHRRRLTDRRILVRYVLVGGSSAAIHLVTLVVLVEVFDIAPILASSIGFLLVAVGAFFAQHWWVYRSEQAMRRTWPRFAITAMAAFAVNAVVLSVGDRADRPYVLFQLVAFILIPIANYVINTLWTFAGRARL